MLVGPHAAQRLEGTNVRPSSFVTTSDSGEEGYSSSHHLFALFHARRLPDGLASPAERVIAERIPGLCVFVFLSSPIGL